MQQMCDSFTKVQMVAAAGQIPYVRRQDFAFSNAYPVPEAWICQYVAELHHGLQARFAALVELVHLRVPARPVRFPVSEIFFFLLQATANAKHVQAVNMFTDQYTSRQSIVSSN